MLSKYMFAELFHNHFVKTITRFVAGGLLVLLLLTAVTPVANAQATSDPFAAVGNVIGNMILTVGASFAKMGGLALDFSTNYLVLGMGDLINSEQLRGAINSLWTVIRDICNLFFIFAFIYIGIKTILDADDANAKRFLAQIIISAFLINFSLFFTKIVIDFSNLTAISVKEAMMPRGTFSENFTQQLGLSGIYSLVDGKALSDLTKGGGIWYSLIATLFLFVSAFVFVAGAVMLVIRFVALIFIMIFSPVYFAAMLFPLTSSYSSKVMSALFSYSFFAPVYFLLLLISMRVVEALNNPLSAGGNLGSAVRATDVTASGSVIVFSIAIIFMIQSLLLAQKLGMVGGNTAVSVGNKIRGSVQSFAGRNTAGRLGAYVNKKQKDGEEGNSKWGRRGALALKLSGINEVASTASSAKWGGSTSRVDSKKEGEALTQARERNKRVATQAADIRAGAPASSGAPAKIQMEKAIASASTEQMLKLLEEFKEGTPEYKALVANMSASQFDSLMKAKPEELDDAKKQKLRDNRAKAVEERVTGGGTLTSTIGKADAKDLDALDFTEVYNHAGQLTSKQIDDMNLTPTAKKQLKDKRAADLDTEFNTGGPGAGAATLFGRITSETERAKLPKDILNKPQAAQYLTQGVLTKMLDNDGIPTTERLLIKTNVLAAHPAGSATNRAFRKFFTDTPAGKQYI